MVHDLHWCHAWYKVGHYWIFFAIPVLITPTMLGSSACIAKPSTAHCKPWLCVCFLSVLYYHLFEFSDCHCTTHYKWYQSLVQGFDDKHQGRSKWTSSTAMAISLFNKGRIRISWSNKVSMRHYMEKRRSLRWCVVMTRKWWMTRVSMHFCEIILTPLF